MEDNQDPKNNPSNLPVDDEQINDDKGKGQGSSDSPSSKQEEAYRRKQSEADKNKSEADALREDVDFLQNFAYEKLRDDAVSDFLKEKGAEYPNVSAADLKRLVTSPDDMEEHAKWLQDKHQEIAQQTLADARDVPEDSMTQSEKEEALSKIKPSASSFKDYLKIATTKLRK